MSSFADFSAEFFKKYFELHPTEAINYGIEGEITAGRNFVGLLYLPFESTVLTWNRRCEITHLNQPPRGQSEEPKENQFPGWLIFYQ